MNKRNFEELEKWGKLISDRGIFSIGDEIQEYAEAWRKEVSEHRKRLDRLVDAMQKRLEALVKSGEKDVCSSIRYESALIARGYALALNDVKSNPPEVE